MSTEKIAGQARNDKYIIRSLRLPSRNLGLGEKIAGQTRNDLREN